MKLSVVIVGGINRSTRIFSIPNGVLTGLGLLFGLFLIVCVYGCFYIVNRIGVVETRPPPEASCEIHDKKLAEKSARISALQDQIEKLNADLEKIGSKLDGLFLMDVRIREYLGLEVREFIPLEGSHQGGIPPQVYDGATDANDKRDRYDSKLRPSFDILMEYANIIEKSKAELMNYAAKQEQKFRHMPSILPVRGNDIWLSSIFGYRKDPFTGKRGFHNGLDIAGGFDAAIIAPADGVVEDDERDRFMGNVIRLDHGQGMKTAFGHLSLITVKKNDNVKRGQVIGYMGNSGRSTGTHLHYSIIRNDEYINPMDYVWDYRFDKNRINPFLATADQ